MPAEPADLKDLRVDVLRQAVRSYLGLAYPGVEPPASVRRRLDWVAGAEAGGGTDAEALLNAPPFERAGEGRSGGSSVYALRLGNARYPHMKMQVRPWPNPAGFLLSVNTHDQVLALDPAANDVPAFRELQAENQRLKEQIEQLWDEQGLPTFLRYLREYLADRTGDDAPPT